MDFDTQSMEENDLLVLETTELVDDASSDDSIVAATDQPGMPAEADNIDSETRPEALNQNLVNAALQDFLRGQPKGSSVAPGSSSVSLAPPDRIPPSSETAGQYIVSVNIPPPRFLPLSYATSRSGIVYDVRMRFHEDLFPKPNEDAHPEVPGRIASIYSYLMDAGLVSNPSHPELDSEYQLMRIDIREAIAEEICLVHSIEHLRWVQNLAGASIEELEAIDSALGKKNSIYVHNNTWLCASLAAGGAIEAARVVVTGRVKNSIALIRPPGHHAEHGNAEGFCFFNNVCVAARVMQQAYPERCRKLLILDWDVHHGNGIQRHFYEDPNVLYISIHVHENGRFYPQGNYGDHLHCGWGSGLGRNINIPWSKAHMGDADYIYAFQQVVMPIAVEFDPDLVFISAGFDAADGDPLGACHVSPACYGHMTHMLMQLAKGRVVSCLEGGYNLQAIAKSALAMTRVMMGEPPDRMPDLRPTRQGVDTVHQVVRTQAKFWKCMYPKDRELMSKKRLQSKRMHDIIRDWQSVRLWKEHQMIPLFVLRQNLSKSFENQVLATQNYFDTRPLFVIFHDPPEAKGIPNPRTNDLELHNTWLTDVSDRYLDWAVQRGFAVMDINIPKHITQPNDTEDYAEPDQEELRANLTRELAHYLWQNYIETGDATHVMLMGVGDAYVGIVDLLTEHKTAWSQVDLTVSFVADNTLRVLNRPGDDGSLSYFYKHSLIYVSPEHPAFKSDKRLKKKHGNVIESQYTDLQNMMDAHFLEVTTRMYSITEGWDQSDKRIQELRESYSGRLDHSMAEKDTKIYENANLNGQTARDIDESLNDGGFVDEL